jgi:hypothetical protein
MILKTVHNAGFFSCCTIRLLDIISFFNQHKELPEAVDSSEQFAFYKAKPTDNLIPDLFNESDIRFPYQRRVEVVKKFIIDPQFSDYKTINFRDTLPFVQKYFSPSGHVGGFVEMFEKKYSLDYNNLCAVFYRGNDKNRETAIAPYSEFIDKATEVKKANPKIKFLVQPDETEFLEAFTAAFPNEVIAFEETPHIKKQDSAVFFEMPHEKRPEFAVYFFAAVICLSRCKWLITHSGNCGLWVTLYRTHAMRMHQWFIDKWV